MHGGISRHYVIRVAPAPAGAAEGGHLAVLQWARANCCAWNEYTCSTAAGCGQLATLQWAQANGCDWDRAVCLLVAPAGSETREWIQAQPA